MRPWQRTVTLPIGCDEIVAVKPAAILGPTSDRQPDPWPALDRLPEQFASFEQVTTGVEQAIDLRAVLRPLFP